MSLKTNVVHKIQRLSSVVNFLVVKSEYIRVEKIIEIELSRKRESMKKSEISNDVEISTSRLVFRECQFVSENLKFAEYAKLIKFRTSSFCSFGSINSIE